MQTDSVAETAVVDPKPRTLVGQLKEIDARRPDFPGEHLIVFGLGLLLMRSSLRSRSVLRRALFTAAGTALMGRAASGTGGIARVARIVRRLS